MTKKELIEELDIFEEYDVIVCSNLNGGWDNIERVGYVGGGTPAIFFGGGSPFTDER